MPKRNLNPNIPITANTREEMMERIQELYDKHGTPVPVPRFTHHIQLFMDDSSESVMAAGVAWSEDANGELSEGADGDMLMGMILIMQQMLQGMGLPMSTSMVSKLYQIIEEETAAVSALDAARLGHVHGPNGECPHMN